MLQSNVGMFKTSATQNLTPPPTPSPYANCAYVEDCFYPGWFTTVQNRSRGDENAIFEYRPEWFESKQKLYVIEEAGFFNPLVGTLRKNDYLLVSALSNNSEPVDQNFRVYQNTTPITLYKWPIENDENKDLPDLVDENGTVVEEEKPYSSFRM